MAASSPLFGMQHPARSISLPSRLSPNFQTIEAERSKLKTWEISWLRSWFLQVLRLFKSDSLALLSCIEDLFQSPATHQALLHRGGVKLVEEAVNGSIPLLDTCSIARDPIVLLKEHVQDLQSALRRRGGYLGAADKITAYINFRKKATKDIVKCLRALKQMENRNGFVPILDADHYLATIVRMLGEVSAVTINIFQHLLSFLSTPAVKSKASGWSLISKLVTGGSLASSRGLLNEVEAVDNALYPYRNGQSDDAKTNLQLVQGRLRTMDASIRSLEAGLDRLFRHLVRNRVCLLNIITH